MSPYILLQLMLRLKGLLRALPLSVFLVSCHLAAAQTMQTFFGAIPFVTTPLNTQLIQASDGGLYGVASALSGQSGPYLETGYFSIVFRFDPVSGQVDYWDVDGSGDTGGALGSSVIEGPDGAVYAVSTHGPAGGKVLRIPFGGQLEEASSFAIPLQYYGAPPNYYQPVTSMTLGSDGGLYITFQTDFEGIGISPLLLRYDFSTHQVKTVETYQESIQNIAPLGFGANGLLEVEPGLFLGTTTLGGTQNDGTLFTYNASSGAYDVQKSFGSSLAAPVSPLVEEANGDYYAIGYVNGPSLFSVSPVGQISAVSPVTSSNSTSASPLTLGPDGNFYGTTTSDGLGYGRLYKVSPSGTVTTLYNFGTAMNDGLSPLSAPTVAADGAIYGVTSGGPSKSVPSDVGLLYKYTPAAPLPSPVTVTASALQNGSFTLSWQVRNAFSVTMQQCYAREKTNQSGAGNWSGLQHGTLSNGLYSGEATITPSNAGTFVYVLTCGGVESGWATVTVPQMGSQKLASATSLGGASSVITASQTYRVYAIVRYSSQVPTGTVSLYANGEKLVVLPLDSQGNASLSVLGGSYPPGTYTLTAQYSGDSTYAPSVSNTQSVTVLAKEGPVTLATYANADACSGDTFPVQTDIFAQYSTRIATGTITYYLGGVSVGSGTLSTQNGIAIANATLQVPNCANGTIELTSKYSGDSNFPASSSTSPVLIGVSGTTVALQADNQTYSRPAKVTLTAYVAQNYYTAVGNGSVTFYANGQALATVPVTSGQASVAAPTGGYPAGNYQVYAVYNGSSTYASSTSQTLNITLQ